MPHLRLLRLSGLCVPLLLALLPSSARADAAAEARFHDELARRYYAAHQYEDAAREFMIEQRLAPNPNIVFNIALCFQRLRRHADAYMYFAEYLGSGDDDAERRRRSERALVELRPRVALLSVQSEPPGAAIFVDRRELGQYGVTPRVLALEEGEHTVWVEREGYRRAETTTTLARGSESSVTLRPEQILGRLRVSAPTQADVRVLDAGGAVIFAGPTPVDTPIPPGTYQVEATSGEERWSEPLVVRAESTTEATAALLGPTGAVTVTANVTGALVSLDGREMGFTPQVLSRVPVGEHAIEVRGDGVRPYSGTLDVAEDDHAWLTVELAEERPFEISPATWVLGGLTIALLGGAGVMTGLAASTHSQFQEARMMGQPSLGLADDSRTFNLTADILWLGAALSAVTTAVLFFTTTEAEGRPSRATLSRGAEAQ